MTSFGPDDVTTTIVKTMRHIAAGGGFGIRQPALQRGVAEVLARCPAILEHLPVPKISNFRLLPDVTTSPHQLGAFAISAVTGKCSGKRNVLLAYCKKNGPLDPETVGAFTALPLECASTKALDEAASSSDIFLQRLHLIAGSVGRVPTSVQRSMSQKGLKSAASILISMSACSKLHQCRVSSLAVRRTPAVRQLRTIGDHLEHGATQRNCVGDAAVLLDVAIGNVILFEVRHRGRVHTASVLCKAAWVVDRVERADNEQVSARCHAEVAALVDPLVQMALLKAAAL